MLQVGAIMWAALGAMIAIPSIGSVNPDARVALGILSVACPLAAALAARALARHRDRLAGVLLVMSVATPTYFAYVVNLPALVVGLALLIAPSAVVRHSPAAHA
jgi:hypothetical protein